MAWSSNSGLTIRNVFPIGFRSSCPEVRCCCGKVCNGLRAFDSVDINETYDDTGQIEHQINVNSIPTIKPGIRLPTSDDDWKLANDCFSASLTVSDIVGSDINNVTSPMNSTIYDYFHKHFGSLENTDSSHFALQGLLYRYA